MKYVFAIILAMLVAPAWGQGPLKGAAQRNDVNNPNKPTLSALTPARGSLGDVLSKLEEVQIADLTVALAYAQASKDAPAIRCYTTWLQTVKDLTTVREQNPSQDGPQLVTAFQKARNLVKMMDTDSPFRMDCAALAADAKKDVRSFISDIVTGVALKALTGGLIP